MTLRATLVVVVLAVVGTVAPAVPANAASKDPSRETVTVHGAGGVALHGVLLIPPGEPPSGGWPAMVMVHGSGPSKATDYLPTAEEFARGGIATLAYDKRTKGYSQFERDYSMLATDALAAIRVLRGRDDVDRDRVGLWGLSEGGWVAPLATSRSADVDFLIAVAANGGPPSGQEQWNLANKLDHAGIRGSLVGAYSTTFTRQGIGAGLFSEANYDPVPALEAIRQPVLALWGEYDQLTPPGESLTTFRQAFDRSGNRHYTLRIVQDGEHALHRTPDGGFTRSEELAPGYVELVTSWVTGLADGPPAASADPAPRQERRTITLAPLAWYESTAVQLGVLGLFLLAFAGYPVVALVRRIRRRRDSAPVRWTARWLAGIGLLCVLGFVGYFFVFLLVTGAQVWGPIVAGRPIPWLLLQLLAIVVVVGLAATAVSWWRNRSAVAVGERVRLGLLLAGGVVFVPWAVYWGLLVP